MKKIALILGLSFVCFGAQAAADWRVVTTGTNPETKEEIAVLTIDKDSIKEAKGIREAWTMWNFKNPRKNEGSTDLPEFKSYKNLTEYNCKEKTMRLTKEILYVENDATGKQLDHSEALKDSKFLAPTKDSLAEKIMDNFVCSEKIANKKTK
ncbi:MAG: transcriptional regulator [Glaciimonas sp.]|nr:transcriptional regulator [Glaciimonas sp.]